jgi:hypothetical protein
MKSTFWYPFRSAEVQEINEHLSPDERLRLEAHSGRWGAVFGIGTFFAVYALMRLVDPLLRPHAGPSWTLLILAVMAVPLGLLIGWTAGVPWRRKVRRILCETEYARQRGFTPETLPLYSTRFSLWTLLAWAVPWAALVAWIAAWDGPFVSKDQRDHGFNAIVKLNLIVVMTLCCLGLFAYVRSRARSKRESTVDG